MPWRKRGIIPYEVWVSEVMLQQTQVSRVIDYYNRFLQRFPTVFDLAQATWQDFLPFYAGLGYYRRGRNMLRTAQIIVAEYGGQFPADKKLLMDLPGVGEYTAAAILSFGFGRQVLAFDTNLQRVLGRFFGGQKNAALDQVQLARLLVLEHLFPADGRKLNAAIMDFANDLCLNKKPRCQDCPLRRQCEYVLSGGAAKEFSLPSSRSDFPLKQARVHLWLHRDHKEYYSADPDRFQVFELPEGVVTRVDIKKYFLEKYGLQLAVRSPHKKLFLQGRPVMFVNAQILLGEHQFGIFSAQEVRLAPSPEK